MKYYKYKIVLLFIFISNLAFGNPYDPIGEDDPEEPIASINSWIVYMLIFGLIYAFFIFKKRQNALKS